MRYTSLGSQSSTTSKRFLFAIIKQETFIVYFGRISMRSVIVTNDNLYGIPYEYSQSEKYLIKSY